MTSKRVTTVLHLVTEHTLGELLLGFSVRDLRTIAKAYGVHYGRRDRLTVVAALIVARDKLHGNIRITIHPPAR